MTPSCSQFAHRLASVAFAAALLGVLTGCEQQRGATPASVQKRLDSDDFASAAIDAKNLLKSRPELAVGRYLLGKALTGNGDFAGAEIEFERANEAGHPESELVPALAALELAKGKPAEVVRKYGGVGLTDAKGAADLQTLVAQAQLTLGDAERAAAAITTALAKVNGYTPALVMRARVLAMQGDVEAAKRIASQLVSAEEGNATAWVLQGDLLASESGTSSKDAAEKAYRKAIELRGRNVEAHGGLVGLLLRQNSLKAASEAVKAMRGALPNHPSSIYYQALNALIGGNLREAHEATRRLMSMVEPRPRLLLLAGIVEARVGSLQQAETYLTRAAQAMPDSDEPALELASVHLRLNQPDRALTALQHALAEGKGSAAVWRVAGQAYFGVGDFKRSDQAFEQAKRLRPNDAALRVDIGRSLIARGQVEPGLRELESAAQADTQGIDAEMEMVSAYMRSGNSRAALAALGEIERKQPQSPSPDHLRGRILAQENKLPGAKQAFEKSLQKDATYLPAVQSLAAMELANNQPEAAAKLYESLLKRKPASAEAMLALADITRRVLGNDGKAADWVSKAVAAKPQDPAVWLAAIDFHRQAKDFPAMLSRARDALAALPDHVSILPQVAEAQMEVGDTQQALGTLARLVQIQPNSAEAHDRLAQAALRAGKLSLAAQSASKALAITPDWPPAIRSLMAAEVKSNGSTSVLPIIKGLQSRLPNQVIGWQLEGEMHAAMGQWAASAASFKKALTKGESSGLAIALHAALLQAAMEAEAAQWQQRWLKPRPDDLLFLVHLGDTALLKGDWRTAEAHYRHGLKVQPDAPALLNHLAYAMLQQKNAESVTFAKRAVVLVPYRAEYVDTLAQAYAVANKMDLAIRVQSRALSLAPGISEMRLRLAQYHLRVGEKAKALEELGRLEQRGLSGSEAGELKKLLQQARS